MQQKHTFLALGDSYTIGESVSESERWPMQLVAMFNKKGKNYTEPRIIAKTGWTTGELQSAVSEATIIDTYDLVSLLIGVNNQYRGNDPEEYRKEFKALLEQAIGFAGGRRKHVFVVSIPDWGVTPFAEGRDRAEIAKMIGVFNAIGKKEAEAAGVIFIDITPGSKKAATDIELVASDGLHPSGKMYLKWAETIFEKIVSVHLIDN